MDEQTTAILELIAQPAFLAKDNKILRCNRAARSLLPEDTELSAVLGKSEALFSRRPEEGTLNISLTLGAREYSAAVTPVGDSLLFLLSPHTEAEASQAYALTAAALTLRRQLHSIVNAADTLFEALPEEYSGSDAAAQLNRSIYRFIRLCGQMSDGGQLLLGRKEAKKTRIDLSAFFADFISQAQPLVESTDIALRYEPCSAPVSADVDCAMLETALYQLLSNALTYTPKGGSVTIKTEKHGQFFLVSVMDDGEGYSFAESGDFSLSESVNADPRRGLGLGLTMVREIAALHGGSLILSRSPSGRGTAAVFSLSLSHSSQALRSTAMPRFDSGSEFHRGLVELSEVLDAKLYDPNEIQ